MKESFTLQELGERWSISVRTLYRLIETGNLKAFRIGESWRVKREEVLYREEPIKDFKAVPQRTNDPNVRKIS